MSSPEPDRVAGPGADAEVAAVQLIETVAAVAGELHPQQPGVREVTLDSHLERDLALDSLGRVELLARVEKTFDVALPERLLVEMETPRDLLRALLCAGDRRVQALPSEVVQLEAGTARSAPLELETLTAVLDWHAAAQGERAHIRLHSDEDEGEVITYAALKREAEALAAGLQRRDLQPGEAVVIMLPTGRDYFRSF